MEKSNFTSHLAVRITPQMLARLERIAQRSDLTVAQVVRILIAAAPVKVDPAEHVDELLELGAARARITREGKP